MDFKTIMSDLIEGEISLIEQNGEKVRLKSVLKKRIIYTVIFGVIFFFLNAVDSLFLALIDLVVYFICMYKITNISVITKLAKESPDTPISEIIRGDMK